MPKRRSKETGEPGWREPREKGRVVEERVGKRKEAGGPRVEKSGRGSRLVERALRERN